MAQTKAGGVKTSQTLRTKYGEDYWAKIGSVGGKVSTPTKGFGTDERNLVGKLLGHEKRAVWAGRRGGMISKRTAHATTKVRPA